MDWELAEVNEKGWFSPGFWRSGRFSEVDCLGTSDRGNGESSSEIWKARKVVEAAERKRALLSQPSGQTTMSDTLISLAVLPCSAFCASVGFCLGGWLGSMGLPIQGESQYLLWGGLRGATVGTAGGWRLPPTLVKIAIYEALLALQGYPSAHVAIDGGLLKFDELEGESPTEEVKRLREMSEYCKMKCQDAQLKTLAATRRIEELEQQLKDGINNVFNEQLSLLPMPGHESFDLPSELSIGEEADEKDIIVL